MHACNSFERAKRIKKERRSGFSFLGQRQTRKQKEEGSWLKKYTIAI
jgi:hypothetical protein